LPFLTNLTQIYHNRGQVRKGRPEVYFMAHEYTTWAWHSQTGSMARKLILVHIADATNAEGISYPGQKRIAKQTEMCERSVREHLAALEKAGFIKRQQRRRENGSRTSDYILLPPLGPDGRPGANWQPANSAGSKTNRQMAPSSPANPAGPELPVEPSVNKTFSADAESLRKEGGSQADQATLLPAPEQKEQKQKGSAAPRKSNKWVEFLRECADAYERRRHKSWAKLDEFGISRRGQKWMTQFADHYERDYELAAQRFEWAVAWAARYETWWAKMELLDFDTLANDNKLLGYAQKAAFKAEQNAAKGLTPAVSLEGREGASQPATALYLGLYPAEVVEGGPDLYYIRLKDEETARELQKFGKFLAYRDELKELR
jgi:hypothetical protein